jgi:ankyrin repeat protein
MMAQNTPEDKDISDFDSWISALRDRLETMDRFGRDLQTDPRTEVQEHKTFLKMRGQPYENALGSGSLINATRSQAEWREEFVLRRVQEDCDTYAKGLPACGRIECWAAREKFVNIVVALIRRREADDPKSLNEGLLALVIAAENNDLEMVDALKDIAVADESFKSSESDLFSPHTGRLNWFKCDTPVYELYPRHEVWLCPIEPAARLGHVDMLRKLIELREAKMEADQEKRKELSEMVMKNEHGEATMMSEKSKWRRAFYWAVRMGHLEVVKFLIEKQCIVDWNEASSVNGLLDEADVNSYGRCQTPLALAVLSGQLEVVKLLCETTEGDFNAVARNRKEIMLLQKAYQKAQERHKGSSSESDNPKSRGRILQIFMERLDTEGELRRLTEERKVHVDAVNAIHVGTALIATATFAGWLSPPLGYSSPPGTDGPFASVEGHPILESFWVFNSLSFFFSIATFMVGANVALPPPEDIYIRDVVQALTVETWTSLLPCECCSLLCYWCIR